MLTSQTSLRLVLVEDEGSRSGSAATTQPKSKAMFAPAMTRSPWSLLRTESMNSAGEEAARLSVPVAAADDGRGPDGLAESGASRSPAPRSSSVRLLFPGGAGGGEACVIEGLPARGLALAVVCARTRR